MSARAEPRTTRDVDVVVAVEDDAEAESILFRLQGFGFSVVSLVEQTAALRLATARLRSSEVGRRGIFVDLLFASSGIEAEVAAAAEDVEIAPGLSLPIARVGHLIALKALARDDRHRPQDYDDLRALALVASHEELERARAAVQAIEALGFARGRRLSADLESLLLDAGDGRDGSGPR